MTKERDPKTDRDMELKEVCRIMGPVELEVIKSFLESHGIACVTRATWVQSISPISVNGLGEIRILVAEKDYEVAKELLETRTSLEEE